MNTTLTFRTESGKRDALDSIATALDRDRSYILNQAIDNYIDVYQWQEDHIRQGQAQALAGDFVQEGEWRKAFSRHRP